MLETAGTQMSTPSHLSIETKLRKVIAGVEANLSGTETVTLAGRAYKRAELIKIFQAQLDAMQAVTELEGALAGARAARAKTARRVLPVQRALEEYVRAIHGATNPKLADYGFVPDAPRKVTAKTKAEAVAKGRATRIARHTMGRKQRLKVKGTVDGSGGGADAAG